LARSTFHLI